MKQIAANVHDGEVADSTQESKTCQKCNGTGLTGAHMICNNCQGFGFMSSKKVPCHRCKGTGFSGSHVVCSLCRGAGTLPKKKTGETIR